MIRCVASIAVLLAACTVDDVELQGKRCPCAPGWACDSRGICVEHPESGARDAGSPDARGGIDSGSDAGARDAGADAGAEPTDAGLDAPSPVDAGADSGPSPIDCGSGIAGLLACNDFEAGIGSWAIEEVTGTVTVADTMASGGARSLHGVTTAAEGQAAVSESFTATSSGQLWFRGYYYVPSSLALTGTLSFVYAWQNDGMTYPGVSAGIDAPGRAYVWTPSGGYAAGMGTVPRDTWLCVEVGIVISGTAGEVIVRFDGVEVQRVTGIDTHFGGAYDRITAGLERAGAALPAAELYADDIALATSPIGCD